MAENKDVTVTPDKKSTKKFLIIYCIAIFVFAVSLILIVSFSQQRIERDAAALQSKAADKATLLDGAMTENARLTKQVETLTAANNNLTTQVAGLERRLNALAALNKIVNYARIGDDLSKQTAITAFEEKAYPGILTPDEQAIYNSVK